MARRNEHSREELHEMTLQAAESIVGAEGYRGLSARKVAAAIGYTVGTLYLLFENLDDLVLQVNARTLDALHAALQEAAGGCTGSESCLCTLGRAYIAFARAQPKRWNMLYEHVVPQERRIPDWYRERLDRLFALVEGTLRPLADRHDEVEIRRAARVLWGGVHGICLLKLTHRADIGDEESVEVLTDTLIRNFLRGFAG